MPFWLHVHARAACVSSTLLFSVLSSTLGYGCAQAGPSVRSSIIDSAQAGEARIVHLQRAVWEWY